MICAEKTCKADISHCAGDELVQCVVCGGILCRYCGGLEPYAILHAHTVSLKDAAPEMYEALRDALGAMQAWSDEHDGADPFGLSCPCCDGLPVPHSLGCRIRAALALAKGEK